MKRNIIILLFSLPLFLFAQEENYIKFNGKSKMYKAEGYANDFKFTHFVWDKNPTSINAEVEVNLNSISEKSQKLVNHLKKDDFFYVELFPNAYITVDSVSQNSDTTFLGFGNLRIKDISQPIQLAFSLDSTKTRINGSSNFDRTTFQLGDSKSIDETIQIKFAFIIPEKNIIKE